MFVVLSDSHGDYECQCSVCTEIFMASLDLEENVIWDEYLEIHVIECPFCQVIDNVSFEERGF